MNRVILSASTDETILAVTRQHKLVDLEIEQQINTEIVGCIYKGVVKNIVPAVDGIFVDIGIGKNAFLRRKDLLNEKRFPTEGSPILAQVIKSDTDMKGALITEKISMFGKYAVTLSGTGYIGVSKKIRQESVRKKLKEIGKEICAEHMGLIIRTAAENADMDEFRKDITRLKENWDIIQKRFRMEKSPTLLYRESDIIVKALRDYVNKGTEILITDNIKPSENVVFIRVSSVFLPPCFRLSVIMAETIRLCLSAPLQLYPACPSLKCKYRRWWLLMSDQVVLIHSQGQCHFQEALLHGYDGMCASTRVQMFFYRIARSLAGH